MLIPSIRLSLVASLVLGLPAAALAAAAFPGGSGVGLDPPPGMSVAKGFNGFQGNSASIIITELPKQAYERIAESRDMFAMRFGSNQTDSVDINGAHGFLVKGEQVGGPLTFRKWVVVLDGPTETAIVSVQVPVSDTTISDSQVTAALHSIVFRPRPGLLQQIEALPFTIGDLAGFRISGTDLGVALILVDGPKDVDPAHSQAHIVVTANAEAPPKVGRAVFAEGQLQTFQAVRTTEIRASQIFVADGSQWAEVQAKGTEGQQETPVWITYYVRFEKDRYLSIVCIAPRNEAAAYAERFRKVALSVTPKS